MSRRARWLGIVAAAAALLLGAAALRWATSPAAPSKPRAVRAPAKPLTHENATLAPPAAAREPALALLSTSVSDVALRSTATVLDLETSASEIVRTGDALASHPGVSVSAIGPRWAELTNGQRFWLLALAEEPLERTGGIAEFLRILGDPELAPGDRVEQLRAADAGQRNVPNLLSEAAFAPWEEDGRVVALVLTHVEPDGFYARLGLAAGDVLREINGLGFDRPEAYDEVVTILERDSSLHLLVESGGEVRRLLVDLAPGPRSDLL